MEYCLDAGDGTASIWTGPGHLDLDGDGLLDDMIADGDGDGLGDYAALDLDDDGVPEARYTDDGTGTWAAGLEPPAPSDVDGDGTPERLSDVDRDGVADRAVSADGRAGYIDTDGDGRWDVTLTDSDGDGAADSAGPFAAPASRRPPP